MFSFLKDLDYRLFERYRTLERNIKSASNSFYDSYLDLQEQFLRIVLENEGVETSSGNSSGSLLKNPACQNLLLSVIGIDQRTYDKMGDSALKVNAHKHKKEKRITLDTILNYLGVIYDATFAYAKFKGVECSPLEISAYAEMFGVFERENATLRTECDKLREELSSSVEEGKLKDSDIETFKSLASRAELDKLSLEEQNSELQKQISILKDIKLASMEDKLNKTIEMLLSLQESVVENRAISYAVGDTICGSERFKEYVEKAKENISIDNVFDKINTQSETVEEIAAKLHGVSINDLYVLAQRTWDYQDYDMAQKYYNHISLLSPLDWEAPLRASLCGEMGRDIVSEWEHKPHTVFGYFKSTVKYLLDRDLPQQEKYANIVKASKIFFDVLKRYEDVYMKPGNKAQLDKDAPGFKKGIYSVLDEMKQLLEDIKHESLDALIEEISNRSKTIFK